MSYVVSDVTPAYSFQQQREGVSSSPPLLGDFDDTGGGANVVSYALLVTRDNSNDGAPSG